MADMTVLPFAAHRHLHGFRGGFMGVFSDAWDAGQAEKLVADEAGKQKQEQLKTPYDQSVAEANRWFDNVLMPVVMQARTELQSKGLELHVCSKVAGDPVQGGFTISGYNNKVVTACVKVNCGGAVALGDCLTNSARRGTMMTMTPGEITSWLKSIITALAKS
jgi:hypothetical protein